MQRRTGFGEAKTGPQNLTNGSDEGEKLRIRRRSKASAPAVIAARTHRFLRLGRVCQLIGAVSNSPAALCATESLPATEAVMLDPTGAKCTAISRN